MIMRHKAHEDFVQAVIARSAFNDEAIQNTANLTHHSGLLPAALCSQLRLTVLAMTTHGPAFLSLKVRYNPASTLSYPSGK
jgi:hypothetical protein